MNKIDAWSRVLDRSLDIIFAKYPARTGLGIVLGSVISFLTNLFEPALKNIAFADFAGAPWWGWLPLGVITMHIPTIIFLFKQKSIGNDSVDQALELIERGNFTQAERRQQYRNLVEKVANSVALSQDAQQNVKRIENGISQQDLPSSNK